MVMISLWNTMSLRNPGPNMFEHDRNIIDFCFNLIYCFKDVYLLSCCWAYINLNLIIASTYSAFTHNDKNHRYGELIIKTVVEYFLVEMEIIIFFLECSYQI